MKNAMILCLMLWAAKARAATYTWMGGAPGNTRDWNTAANWSPGGIPTAADKVVVPPARTFYPQTRTSGFDYCKDLQISSGASLEIRQNTNSFSISGDIDNDGTITITGTIYSYLNSPNGKISGSGDYSGIAWNLNAGASYTFQNRASPYIFYELYIQKGAAIDLGDNNLTVRGIYAEGNFKMGTGTLEIQGEGVIGATEAAPEAGKFNPYFPTGQTGEGVFDPGSGTVYYNGSLNSQFVRSAVYHHLKIATASGNTAYLGNAAGAAALGNTANGAANSITVNGNLDISALSSGGAATTYNNISLNNGSFSLSANNANSLTLNLNHPITKSGSQTSFTMGNNAANRLNVYYAHNTDWAIKGFTHPYTFYGTVNYESASLQLVMPDRYQHLILDGKNAASDVSKPLTADTEIAGNLLFQDKALLESTVSNFDINISGNWTDNSASFACRQSKVTFEGSAAQTISKTGGTPSTANITGTVGTAAIPDNQSLSNSPSLAQLGGGGYATASLNVTGDNYVVASVNLSIGHTYNGDLDIFLVAPDNSIIEISTDNGKNQNGYNNVFFSLSAATAVSSFSNTNRYFNNETLRPEGSWAAAPTKGLWRLFVGDDQSGETGTLTNFSMSFNVPAATAEVFYDLKIDNGSGTGVSLACSAEVLNTLELNDGKTNTAANLLIMKSTAAASLVQGAANAGFANSWVNGNLRRYLAPNTALYEFPVGLAAGLRRASIQNNGLAGLQYLTANFNASVTGTIPLDAFKSVDTGGLQYARISTDGSWTIDPDLQPASGSYSIKLYTSGFSGLQDNLFGIMKRPSGSVSAAAWDTWAGTASIAPANGDGRLVANGYAKKTGFTNFSEMGLAVSDQLLPIGLLSFTVAENGKIAVLDWEAISDDGYGSFEIERSPDGLSFSKIGQKQGSTSPRTEKHRWEDAKPLEGVSYYRLKISDGRGGVSYSKTLSAYFEGMMAVNLYPNPSEGESRLLLENMEGESVLFIRITDSLGRMVKMMKAPVSNGKADVQLDGAALGIGVYVVSFLGQKAKGTVRWVVI